MEFNTGSSVVRKNSWLWLLPTAVSMGWLLVGLLFGSMPVVKPGLNIKFTVPNGMPELGSILQMQQVDISAIFTPKVMWYSLAGIVVGALLSGGWLAGVFRAIWGRTTDQGGFLESAHHYFLRLLGARLLTFFTIVLLAVMLGVIGVLLMLVVMFFTFFWEIAIVREDLSIGAGLTRGSQILQANLGEVFRVGLPIALATAVISGVASLLAQSLLGYVLIIPAWAYLGAGFSVDICTLYDLLVGRAEPPQA